MSFQAVNKVVGRSPTFFSFLHDQQTEPLLEGEALNIVLGRSQTMCRWSEDRDISASPRWAFLWRERWPPSRRFAPSAGMVLSHRRLVWAFQVGNVVRKDSDQLPTLNPCGAEEIDVVCTPRSIVERNLLVFPFDHEFNPGVREKPFKPCSLSAFAMNKCMRRSRSPCLGEPTRTGSTGYGEYVRIACERPASTWYAIVRLLGASDW